MSRASTNKRIIKRVADADNVEEQMIQEPKRSFSGVIDFDPEKCTKYGTCELICSSKSIGMINPTLSCVTVHHNSLDDNLPVMCAISVNTLDVYMPALPRPFL